MQCLSKFKNVLKKAHMNVLIVFFSNWKRTKNRLKKVVIKKSGVEPLDLPPLTGFSLVFSY